MSAHSTVPLKSSDIARVTHSNQCTVDPVFHILHWFRVSKAASQLPSYVLIKSLNRTLFPILELNDTKHGEGPGCRVTILEFSSQLLVVAVHAQI